jgi:hypothetical protein
MSRAALRLRVCGFVAFLALSNAFALPAFCNFEICIFVLTGNRPPMPSKSQIRLRLVSKIIANSDFAAEIERLRSMRTVLEAGNLEGAALESHRSEVNALFETIAKELAVDESAEDVFKRYDHVTSPESPYGFGVEIDASRRRTIREWRQSIRAILWNEILAYFESIQPGIKPDLPLNRPRDELKNTLLLGVVRKGETDGRFAHEVLSLRDQLIREVRLGKPPRREGDYTKRELLSGGILSRVWENPLEDIIYELRWRVDEAQLENDALYIRVLAIYQQYRAEAIEALEAVVLETWSSQSTGSP